MSKIINKECFSGNKEDSESSRRKFIQGCFVAAGAVALGSFGCKPARADTRKGNVLSAGYIGLERSGELERREKALWEMAECCTLCPRECGANRITGETGICGGDNTLKVASSGPHFGEEKPLVGKNGSGTIFFSNCNLLCVYCQNWEINHRGDGRLTNDIELSRMMLSLQRRGCHNINLVTPTHLTPFIISSLRLAIADGLRVPLVYNTSGYDSLEVIKLLDGVVDIYLPDFKYQDAKTAARFSRGAPDYPKHTAAAIKEMHRQVGVLKQNQGVAQRGLLIRHLVLPENLAGTDGFVRWVASELGKDTHVNIMGQYGPQYKANDYPQLSRRPTRDEMALATRWAKEAGLHNFH